MKKHIYVCEKIIIFVLAFALIIGFWGGMGIDVKAEGRIIKAETIQKGDILYAGDIIEFHLGNNIEDVYIYYNIGFIWGATLVKQKYTDGVQITIPESYYKNPKTGKEYRYNAYKFVEAKVDDLDNKDWLFLIEAYDGNSSGSGELVPGGNTSGGGSSENNPSKGNNDVSSTSTSSPKSNNVAKHICSFEWVITLDPTTGADGLEEYKCTGCGVVKESHPIPASVAVVKDFYGKVKEAPEKGSITYDSGKLYTISDYILKKMAERNDVAVTVKFEYQNKKYQIIFPAGLDYSAVLNDEETMYGYFGAAAKLGLKVTGQ